MLPNFNVRRSIESGYSDMGGPREEVCQTDRQTMAEILIEEQLHATEPTRWWFRSAA